MKKDVPPSSVPLKCFNWTKISETKVGGTIWTELDEAKLYKVIDLGEFDKLFSAYQKNGNGLHHVSWSKDGNVAAASERGRSMNN